MDAQMQAMLASNKGGHGGNPLMGVLNELPDNVLNTILPLQELQLQKLLQMLFPTMQQALIFNFPGGTLWNLLVRHLAEKLHMSAEEFKQQMGIGGGESVGHGPVSPGAGGHSGGEAHSGVSYD